MEDAADMNPVNLHIVYDGPALETHRMDVKDLAPALLALGSLLDRANEMVNQDRAQVRVEVHASFREGSFGITFEVVQSLGARVLDLLVGNHVTGTINLITLLGFTYGSGKGALWLIRKLKGRSIERFELLADGKAVVYLDQEMLTVEKEVLDLVRDYKIRRHFEQLIAKPLEQDGIETFAVADPKTKKIEVLVEKAEAQYFVAPISEKDEEVDEYIARLQIVTISFVDGNKWRFSDGQQSFFAVINDDTFNARIANREEQFGKDDIIRARIRRKQYMGDGGKLRADYEIVEVLQHIKASPIVQTVLPLIPPSE